MTSTIMRKPHLATEPMAVPRALSRGGVEGQVAGVAFRAAGPATLANGSGAACRHAAGAPAARTADPDG